VVIVAESGEAFFVLRPVFQHATRVYVVFHVHISDMWNDSRHVFGRI
jgi:capsular polysaccharide biosynthesis protein